MSRKAQQPPEETGAMKARARRRASLGLASGPAGAPAPAPEPDYGYGYDDDDRHGQRSHSHDGAGGGGRRAGRRGSVGRGDAGHQRSMSDDGAQRGGRPRAVRRGSVSSGLEGMPGMAARVDAQMDAPPPQQQQYQEEPQHDAGGRAGGGGGGRHRHGGRPGRRRQSLTSGTINATANAVAQMDLGYGDGGPDLGYGDGGPGYDDRAAQQRMEKQQRMMQTMRKDQGGGGGGGYGQPTAEDLGYGDDEDLFARPEAQRQASQDEAGGGNQARRRGSLSGFVGKSQKHSLMDDDDAKSKGSRGSRDRSPSGAGGGGGRRAVQRTNSSDLQGVPRKGGGSSNRHAHALSGDRDRMRPGSLLDRVGVESGNRQGRKGGGGSKYSDRIGR